MMEWWTYGPEDFLLFSERVYWRLFELHNAAVWPAQIASLLIGVAILVLVLWPRPWSSRAVALALAAAWLFVAWAFLWNRYATINWAVRYAVPLFVAEAAILAWFGGFRDHLTMAIRKHDPGGILGMALFIYALALHPLVAVLAGRPLAAAEVFGIAPDPTAMATLGLAATLGSGRVAWLVLAVPLLWCAVSASTLLTLGAWEGWIPLAAVATALLARLWPRRGKAV